MFAVVLIYLITKNRVASESARVLLERFPAEVQHAATKLQLDNSERMWMDSGRHAKALTRDLAASKEEVAALTNHLAASKVLRE